MEALKYCTFVRRTMARCVVTARSHSCSGVFLFLATSLSKVAQPDSMQSCIVKGASSRITSAKLPKAFPLEPRFVSTRELFTRAIHVCN